MVTDPPYGRTPPRTPLLRYLAHGGGWCTLSRAAKRSVAEVARALYGYRRAARVLGVALSTLHRALPPPDRQRADADLIRSTYRRVGTCAGTARALGLSHNTVRKHLPSELKWRGRPSLRG